MKHPFILSVLISGGIVCLINIACIFHGVDDDRNKPTPPDCYDPVGFYADKTTETIVHWNIDWDTITITEALGDTIATYAYQWQCLGGEHLLRFAEQLYIVTFDEDGYMYVSTAGTKPHELFKLQYLKPHIEDENND